MTDTKFTPGPWDSAIEDRCHGVIASAVGGRFVAICFNDNPDDGKQDMRFANARLIAAAPDLYEALADHERRLRHCSKNIEDEYPIWAADLLKMADAALAVLAKARGQS